MIAAHQATDVLVQPDVDEIEIRDWKAFDRAVEIGYRATLEVLDGLTHPVVDLRRRASLAEAALSAPHGRTSAN
jgi:NTE family protein